MPCVSLSLEDNETLMAAVESDPEVELAIDLHSMVVTYGEKSLPLTMPEGAREALINAKWDAIQELLDQKDKIEAVAESLPYV